MSLRHAILVTLTDSPATGYEITKRFESGLGHFWQASHQQIYHELGRMADDRLVTGRTVEQETRPTKRVYRITAGGRRELGAWLARPVKPKPLRNAFLVKLFAAHLADRGALAAEIETLRDGHRRMLAHYRTLEAQYFPDPERLDFKHRCMYLTLTRGIANEEAGLRWCEDALVVFGTESADTG